MAVISFSDSIQDWLDCQNTPCSMKMKRKKNIIFVYPCSERRTIIIVISDGNVPNTHWTTRKINEKINSSIHNACIKIFSSLRKTGYFIKSQLICFSFVICCLDPVPIDYENKLKRTAKDNKNCLVIYQGIGDFLYYNFFFSELMNRFVKHCFV